MKSGRNAVFATFHRSAVYILNRSFLYAIIKYHRMKQFRQLLTQTLSQQHSTPYHQDNPLLPSLPSFTSLIHHVIRCMLPTRRSCPPSGPIIMRRQMRAQTVTKPPSLPVAPFNPLAVSRKPLLQTTTTMALPATPPQLVAFRVGQLVWC